MGENLIQQVIIKNLADKHNRFVFPTQTSLEYWVDYIICNTEYTALEMERFIPWDVFKADKIKAKQQNKQAVPSAMRHIFAANLINENKSKTLFKNIINPEYSADAENFTKWIANLIPALSLWKTYFEKNGGEKDAEDEDLLVLYEEYNKFLKEYDLFDPAWEFPPFEADGYHYYIFYPEILSDYCEYEKILKDSPDITEINVSKTDTEKNNIYFYSNARAELKALAIKLRECFDKGISWNEMAVNVPDLENYSSYLDRELDLYEIPHVIKFSKPLNYYGAGCLFEQINSCIKSSCNYESLRDLLLNTDLPWKDKVSANQLLEFGKNNHCICNYDYKNINVDVWEESFKLRPGELRAYDFYKELKLKINEFNKCDSFKDLREKYFEFRNRFFDMDDCIEKSDRILSRCITELGGLIDLEEKYSKLKLNNPFTFFVDYIKDINYLEQMSEQGVQVLPYKMAATAPFKAHFIIDASQSSISVIYKELSFLNDNKRNQILGFEDANVTEAFVKLYGFNSMKEPVYFSASERTLSGYSQSCSYLEEVDMTAAVAEDDYLRDEKNWFLEQTAQFPKKISAYEKCSFENWAENQKKGNYQSVVSNSIIKDTLNSKKLNISNSSLAMFYSCPRQWYFNYVLGLKEPEGAAILMDKYAIGNLYHKILEIYCKQLKKKNKVLHTTNEGLPEEYQKILDESIKIAIEDSDVSLDERKAFLTQQIMNTTIEAIRSTIFNTVEKFSSIFEGCKIVDNETWLNYDSPDKNYKCNGRIDCLLQSEDNGEYFLVDFKTSKSQIEGKKFFADRPEINPEEESVEVPLEERELPDFQMPMYIFLFENGNQKKEIQNVCFFNASEGTCHPVYGNDLGNRCPPKKGQEIKSRSDFDYTIELLVKCMDNFGSRIMNGDLSTNPKIQDFKTCSKCTYKAICRKTFNVCKKD